MSKCLKLCTIRTIKASDSLDERLCIHGKRGCKGHQRIHPGAANVLATLLQLLYRPDGNARALGKFALAQTCALANALQIAFRELDAV